MKEFYVNADLEIVEFEQTDIISTSGVTPGCDWETPMDDPDEE